MPQWTDEQRQVIDSRGQNLLVSAAAGSGKSAVLVQRIMEKTLDTQHPVDIDRMLVVTFTNAAAASLRQKIRAGYEEEAASDDPARARNAMRQLSLLAADHIETIDRFCREIVLDHADALSIDPSFRIADEGERKLLRSEVVSAVIEESLENPDEEMRRACSDLSRLYAPGKTDEALEELILDFYEFSTSHEFPKMWRHQCASLYRTSSPDQEWVKDLTRSLRMSFQEMHESLLEGLRLCAVPGGPYHYASAMADHEALLKKLMNYGSMEEYALVLSDYSWPRPRGKKRAKDAPFVDERLEREVKRIREAAAKALKKLKETVFYAPEDVIDGLRLSTARYMDALVFLTDLFEERFSREKRERGIADFSDVSHWALRVLIEVDEDQMPVFDGDGNYIRTALAKEYEEYFREIYIDEYQDSNRVQEILLSSISRPGGRFMVGDMKQSIYRFRMADPGIFLEKADSWPREAEAKDRRIDLHRNFRSRACTLDAVNLIFAQIMRRETGGVEYTKDQELVPGYAFPLCREEYIDESANIELNEDPAYMVPELILVGREEVSGAVQNAEAEAAVVAERILEMVGRMPLYNKERGEYAPAGYGDITILLRSAAHTAEIFSRVLDEYGIPNRPDASTGYFDAPEVRSLLAYLNVLDNPRQDIALAASLRSVIGGLDDKELALIRARYRDESFYDAVMLYSESGEDAVICEKLDHFLDMTKELRSCVRDTPIHTLLWKIFDETGYERKVSAMRGGRQKRANLSLLVDMAIRFEETSYRGLFHFVRYIEKMRKAQEDIGQAPDSASGGNLVRIMTMHRSKGLEFPIVFVSGLSKGFNLMDARGNLVLHERLGAGMDYCEDSRRIRVPNRIRSAVAGRIRTDAIGEELRVLYVALTRAEQKLIMTGCVDSVQKAVEKAMEVRSHQAGKLPKGSIEGASCMLDWILASLARHGAERDFFDSGRWEGASFQENEAMDLAGRVLIRTGQEVLAGRKSLLQAEERRLEDLYERDAWEVEDPAYRSRLEYMLHTAYAWPEGKEHIPGKVSVSAIKQEGYQDEMRRLASEEGNEQPAGFDPHPDDSPEHIPVPDFRKESEEGAGRSGAERGTAYHLLLSDIDFAGESTCEQIRARLESMIKCDRIQKEAASGIDPQRIASFLSSPLGERMRLSARKGMLWREQPFVIQRRARVIRPEWDSDEWVLIQGIIDAFFLEEGEAVLVDYKTDRARPGDEKSLVARYRMQFELYAGALEQLLQKRVKEAWLYSLSLNKAVEVKLKDRQIPPV